MATNKYKDPEWESVKSRAWRRVHEITAVQKHMPPPVALSALAAAIGVRHLEFRPLLTDAGIIREGDGYALWLNTENPEGVRVAGMRLNIEHEDWQRFSHPLRFTIAHELAHKIVVDVTPGGTNSPLLGERHEERLESLCSKLAGGLLLPQEMLVKELEGSFFNTAHLRLLLERFGVSAMVFMLHLVKTDAVEDLRRLSGFLALVERGGESFIIRESRSFGGLAEERFNGPIQAHRKKSREKDCPLEVLKLGVAPATLLDKDCIARQHRVPWRVEDNSFLPCTFSCSHIKGSTELLLLSFEILGPMEKPE